MVGPTKAELEAQLEQLRANEAARDAVMHQALADRDRWQQRSIAAEQRLDDLRDAIAAAWRAASGGSDTL